MMLDIKQKSKEMSDSVDREMDNLRKDFSKKLGLDNKMRFSANKLA